MAQNCMQTNRAQNNKKNPPQSKAAQEAYELGYEYESVYGACSQCTILAIMGALDERDSSVFKAAFGFAGGIGSLSKTCGALAAGVMAMLGSWKSTEASNARMYTRSSLVEPSTCSHKARRRFRE